MSAEAEHARPEQTNAPTYEPFVRAFLDYKRAVEEVLAPGELQRRMTEAYRTLSQANAEALMPDTRAASCTRNDSA